MPYFDAKTDTPATTLAGVDKFTFGSIALDGYETITAANLLAALQAAVPVVAVTAAATATLGASHRVSGAGPFTLTLPAATEGAQVAVRVVNSFTGLLTLSGGSVPIGGSTTRIMWAGESAIVRYDATEGQWQKIGGRSRPMLCTIRRAAAIAIPDSTFTDCQPDTTVDDPSGTMADLANKRVNVQRPGSYVLTGSIQFGGLSAGSSNCTVAIFKNGLGGTNVASSGFPAAAGSYPTPAAAGVVTLAAGDNIKLAAYQGSGTVQNLLNGAHPLPLSVLEVPTW